MRKQGFSIIELLVVVAIIMILLAMLFPILRSTRWAAHKAACVSNLRQMGLAVSQYAENNHGYFPRRETRGNAGIWSMWAKDIVPYMDLIGEDLSDTRRYYGGKGYLASEFFICPSDNDTYLNDWSNNSYTYNSHLSKWDFTWKYDAPVRLPVERRSQIAIIADGYAYFATSTRTRVYYRHDTFRIDNHKMRRRGGSCNVLFGDMRVENVQQLPNSMRKWY
jgi:prepilin-type N-terminal cleavage/methylation domain-containing protein